MNEKYICPPCEDTGYQWDTAYSCPKCDKGKAVQYHYDKHDLKSCIEQAKILRQRIKLYEEKNKGEVMPPINQVINKCGAEVGMIVANVKPGCILEVLATDIDKDGKIDVLRQVVYQIPFDELTKLCPGALFYTIRISHPDDLELKPIERT